MHFAVLGTGDVGKALAAGLHKHGHAVTLGTRDPDATAAKLADWRTGHPGIALATFADAAAGADALVLCIGWNGAEAVCDAVRDHAAGKTVIDVTNPLKFEGDGPPGLAVHGEDSGGETVQRWLPKARVVKCWNIVGNANMIDPDLPDGPPTMLIAGDDADAKAGVTALLAEVGWSDTIDLGGIEASRCLEALCIAWVRVFFATGSGSHAFRVLR